MITCAWCGTECDDSIYFIRKNKVLFSTFPGEAGYPREKLWATNSEKKMFCSQKHRDNWFLEP